MPRYDQGVEAPIPNRGMTVGSFARAIIDQVMIRLRVGVPGTVIKYTAPVPNTTPAFVDVQPDFLFTIEINGPAELPPGYTLLQGPEGYLAQKQLPVIPNAIVHMPAAGPGAMLRAPLQPGVSGWIKFCDRSIDEWKNLGGSAGPIDPAIHRYHALSDAVFSPGLYHGVNTPIVDITKGTVGPEDDSCGVDFDLTTKDITVRTTQGTTATVDAPAEVKCGAAAVDPATKWTQLSAAMTALLAAGAASVGVNGDPSGENAGAAFAAAQVAWDAAIGSSTPAATKARVE